VFSLWNRIGPGSKCKHSSEKCRLLSCNAKKNLERGRNHIELSADNLTKLTQGKERLVYFLENLEVTHIKKR
jgi:hypothetical protein